MHENEGSPSAAPPHPCRFPSVLDVYEAAELLNLRPSWAYEAPRARMLPSHNHGHYVRFDRDELLAWAKRYDRK
jgi:excisionase family DNA binding protein